MNIEIFHITELVLKLFFSVKYFIWPTFGYISIESLWIKREKFKIDKSNDRSRHVFAQCEPESVSDLIDRLDAQGGTHDKGSIRIQI